MNHKVYNILDMENQNIKRFFDDSYNQIDEGITLIHQDSKRAQSSSTVQPASPGVHPSSSPTWWGRKTGISNRQLILCAANDGSYVPTTALFANSNSSESNSPSWIPPTNRTQPNKSMRKLFKVRRKTSRCSNYLPHWTHYKGLKKTNRKLWNRLSKRTRINWFSRTS